MSVVCMSSVHPAETVGQNEMPFGRDTRVIPSNSVLDRDPLPSTCRGDLGLEPPICSDAVYCQITLVLVCCCLNADCRFCLVTRQCRLTVLSSLWYVAAHLCYLLPSAPAFIYCKIILEVQKKRIKLNTEKAEKHTKSMLVLVSSAEETVCQSACRP